MPNFMFNVERQRVNFDSSIFQWSHQVAMLCLTVIYPSKQNEGKTVFISRPNVPFFPYNAGN